ncbi:MAG: hypothetical protein PHT96_14310 [Syntrophorhabdaceae bacterium]|nr:hypothetical protein [Syntrophorhabdaceae bacterium]
MEMTSNRLEKYLSFLDETIEYFQDKVVGVDRDRYISDRDIRSILDKTMNDMILCIADISKELLRSKKRSIPDTYRDMVLACHEILGGVTLKVAPLTRSRNETIHEYLKINWQNIVIAKNKLQDIREFVQAVKNNLAPDESVLEQRFKNLIQAIKSCDPGLVSLELNMIKNNYNLKEFLEVKGYFLTDTAKKMEFKEDDPARLEKFSQIVSYLRAAETGGEIGININIKNKNEPPSQDGDDFTPK